MSPPAAAAVAAAAAAVHKPCNFSKQALDMVEAALASASGGSVSPPSSSEHSGPARKRFLTKYLHKDRGEKLILLEERNCTNG